MTQVVYAKDTTPFSTTHPKDRNGKMTICQTTLYLPILELEANNTIRLFHKPDKTITTGKEILSQLSKSVLEAEMEFPVQEMKTQSLAGNNV